MAIPEELIARAIAVLQRGGVVAAATETSFGLLADATVPEAIERVLSIKGRPEYQPIALLAASIDVAKEVVRFSSRAARLAEEFWPGPLTLVLPERAPLHPALGKDGRVGVRVPGPSPAL
ncbi:MAG: Sua5/YciO/YrdC/YwlC family protein, partial [Myxococcota bacterium]